MTTTHATPNHRIARPWLLALTALAALAAYLIVGSAFGADAAHSAPSPHINQSNTYKINTTGTLAPGGSYTNYWNNTPMGRSYWVEARPGFSASGPCAIEVTRDWRVRTINGSGQPELEVHYTVKNVGSVSCNTEIWLAYVA